MNGASDVSKPPGSMTFLAACAPAPVEDFLLLPAVIDACHWTLVIIDWSWHEAT